MSRLNRLFGAPKSIEIGGISLDIYPFKLQDLSLIMSVSHKDGSVNMDKMVEVIRKTLKRSDPDATDTEIDDMSVNYFAELTEAILEVNGLKNDELPTANPKIKE
ncbi:MAG: hypothetical protein AABY22_25620 [Nanoarchaeota archaeon]